VKYSCVVRFLSTGLGCLRLQTRCVLVYVFSDVLVTQNSSGPASAESSSSELVAAAAAGEGVGAGLDSGL